MPLGTWGKIQRVEQPSGRWVAQARVRDFDGKTRRVTAWGKTGAAAERALLASLHDRVATETGAAVTRDMRVSRLCALWLEEIEAEDRLKPQTIDRYRGIVHHAIIPTLGDIRVREVTVALTDRFLRAYAADAPAQAQAVKQVFGQIIGMAVRHDAIPINPVRNVSRLRTVKKEVRALDETQLEIARRGVRQWRQEDPSGRRPVGPSPNGNLPDIVDIFLATGLRINEVLALRWSDLDLDAIRPTLTVSGTLVQLEGRGIVRQDATKSAAGRRTVYLPSFAVDVLRRRRAGATPNALDAVFTTRNGTWVSGHNVRRQWRAIRTGTGLEWVTPHAFRKTVATMIEREANSKDAAAQLGHASESMTETYYVMKTHLAPDLTRILEKFAPTEQPTPGDQTA
jgi:integrase